MKNTIITGIKALTVSYLITGIILAILSLAVYGLDCTMVVIYCGVIAVYVIANIIGSYMWSNVVLHKRFFVGLIFGSAYFLILLFISIVFGMGDTISLGSAVKVFLVCVCSSIFGSLL